MRIFQFKFNASLLKAILIPIVIALLLRLGYLIQYVQSPFFHSPSIDGIYHLEWAKRILETGEWGQESGKPFFRTPLYPTFLAICFALGLSKVAIVVIQSLLGVLSIYILAKISEILFHRKVAVIATYLLAFCTPMISYEMEFQLPALIIPLSVMILYNFVKFHQSHSFRNGLTASLLIGLLTITQPNGLVFLIPLIFILNQIKSLLKFYQIAMIATFWLIPILPVTIHNYLQSGEFVFLSTQGGVNAYLGNNPNADGAYAVHPELGEDWEWEDAKNILSSNLTDAQADKRYFLKAVQFWWERPFSAILLLIRKIGYIFHWYDIGNNRNLQLFWDEFFITKWLFAKYFFGIVIPVGLIGAYLAWKNQTARIILLSGLIFILSYLPFFITTRYRLPFLLVLIPYAAFALHQFFIKRESLFSYRNLIVMVIAIMLVWHPFGAPKADAAQYYYSKGNAYQNLTQYSSAIQNYKKAISLNPNKAMYFNNLATAFLQLGQLDSAKYWLEKAYKISKGRNGKILNNLGVLQERSKWYFSAMNSYIQAKMLNDRNAANNLDQLFNRLVYSPPTGEENITDLKSFADSINIYKPSLAEKFLIHAKLAILSEDTLQMKRVIEDYLNTIQNIKLEFYNVEKFQSIMNGLMKQ